MACDIHHDGNVTLEMEEEMVRDKNVEDKILDVARMVIEAVGVLDDVLADPTASRDDTITADSVQQKLADVMAELLAGAPYAQ